MTNSRRFRRVIGLAAALSFMALIELVRTAPVHAANWLEKNFWLSGPRYDAVLPACDSGWVLSTIRSRFSTKEGRFWNSDLSIVDVGPVKQVAFRPWAEETIPRRFCSGKVLVSDGRWRAMYYSIIEDGGMIGAKWGVEWCVVGLDRNWSYNPNCKMARP